MEFFVQVSFCGLLGDLVDKLKPLFNFESLFVVCCILKIKNVVKNMFSFFFEIFALFVLSTEISYILRR